MIESVVVVVVVFGFLVFIFWMLPPDPKPRGIFGSCCKPGGCADREGVDFLKAKEECEGEGGTFVPFVRCSQSPCPKTGGCDVPQEHAKNSDPAKKPKPKKAKPKKAKPNSSMKVERKGSKKKPRKNSDH